MKKLTGLLLLFVAATGYAQNLVIYDGTLENGWQDSSWAIVNYANTSPTYNSSYSIKVNDPTSSGYQGWQVTQSPFTTAPYQSLNFWIYPTEAASGQIDVFAEINGTNAAAGYPLTFSPSQVGTWQQVSISLVSLGAANAANFSGIVLQNYAGKPQTFYLDGVSLVGSTAPSQVQLTVNASTVIRTIDSRIYGINADIWDSQLLTTATSNALAAMQTGAMRFPGGGDSDNYNWQTDESITDGGFQWASGAGTFATVASWVGAEGHFIVNYGDGTPEQAAAWVAYNNGATTNTLNLGVDAFGRNWQTVGYWAGLRAAAPLPNDDGSNFLRIFHPAPFGYHYWEVGNEVYGNWTYDQHGASGSGLGGSPNDPYTYATNFPAFANKMKAVDSTVKVGMDGYPGEDSYNGGPHSAPNPNEGNSLHSGWTPVVLATLKSLGFTPDFIIDHIYPENPGGESDPILLQAGSQTSAQASNIRQMITDYVGGSAGAGIELDATELNSVTTNPGKQTTSLINGLFMADAMGQLAATEFNACLWWDLRNGSDTQYNNSASLYGWRPFGDYGVLASGDRSDTPLNTPYPSFYAAKLLTHWGRGGDQVVATTANYAWLSGYAAKLSNGNLALLVVNKNSSGNITAQISINGFTLGSGAATVYSYGKTNDSANADLSTNSFIPGAASFTYTFPSYSMSVLVLPGGVPNLTARLAGGSVIVSWPNTGTFLLEQNTNLAGTNWTTNTSPVTTASGTNSITVNPPTGALFFRLKK